MRSLSIIILAVVALLAEPPSARAQTCCGTCPCAGVIQGVTSAVNAAREAIVSAVDNASASITDAVEESAKAITGEQKRQMELDRELWDAHHAILNDMENRKTRADAITQDRLRRQRNACVNAAIGDRVAGAGRSVQAIAAQLRKHNEDWSAARGQSETRGGPENAIASLATTYRQIEKAAASARGPMDGNASAGSIFRYPTLTNEQPQGVDRTRLAIANEYVKTLMDPVPPGPIPVDLQGNHTQTIQAMERLSRKSLAMVVGENMLAMRAPTTDMGRYVRQVMTARTGGAIGQWLRAFFGNPSMDDATRAVPDDISIFHALDLLANHYVAAGVYRRSLDSAALALEVADMQAFSLYLQMQSYKLMEQRNLIAAANLAAAADAAGRQDMRQPVIPAKIAR